MVLPDDVAFLDATAQAELVRMKEVQPIELVEAAIERIERLNPTLNAVITPMYDLARHRATGQLPDGPFKGVPFLLKDIMASYAGVRMAMGSKLLQNFVPDHDSELVVRLKIAFATRAATDVKVHPDCVRAVQEAATLCAELGHEVEEAALTLNGDMVSYAFSVVWSAGCGSTLKALGSTKDQVEPLTWALKEMSDNFSATDFIHALQILQKISRDVARFFLDYDVLLTPTLAEPPVLLGTFDSPPDNPLQGFERSAAFACFTPLCNMTGQPGMTLPLFWNTDNLPVGTHFTGRFGDEATLFRLAAQLEEARPWADRRPPVSASEEA